MFSVIKHKRRGFTTVEILVAVGLVAILMVVAVPRLLDSRQTVSDSSAKQQLNTVMLSVENWFAERDTYEGLDVITANATALQKRVPNIELVGASATGKGSGGRALTVGFEVKSSNKQVVLAASNGEDNCWGIELSTSGTRYGYVETASCTTAASFNWQRFEFPLAAS